MVNNKFQKIRFLYFFEYWPIPFGYYKYVVKSQNARNDFFLCEIHVKTHFFFKTQDNIYFFFQENNLKYASVLAVCKKTTHFFFNKNIFWKICIFIFYFIFLFFSFWVGWLSAHLSSSWAILSPGWAASPDGWQPRPIWAGIPA